MQLKLPADKLTDTLSLLHSWSSKKKCTKRELLSLIGKLSFICKIIPSGRIFLRRLIDLSTSVQKLSHHISLNKPAREDISWWIEYLPTWNGKYSILDKNITYSPDINLFTDASGSGFGIFFYGKWIACPWPDHSQSKSIQWKELFPIWVTCFIWAKSFHKKGLLCHCDNEAVVKIWSTGSCKSAEISSLLQKIFVS